MSVQQPQRVILLGPPASGKGTQSRLISEYLNVPALGTGNLLRAAIEEQTELGKEADSYLEKGLYVPDELILKLVDEWMLKQEGGWLLDGFPRTQAQADAFQPSGTLQKPDLIVGLRVPQEELEKRISSRRQCRQCGFVTSTFSHPDGECPSCEGGELVARNDDAIDSFRIRFAQYQELTAPLFDFYASSGRFVEVDGCQSPDDVFATILPHLGAQSDATVS